MFLGDGDGDVVAHIGANNGSYDRRWNDNSSYTQASHREDAPKLVEVINLGDRHRAAT